MEKEIETFEWIARIIATSNNDFHFDAIDKLIELHFINFQNEELKARLNELKHEKWNEIHSILV
jgi:hypothetical protein